MQDEDGYITLNIKPQKPAVSSAVTQQNNLQAENENLSGTVQKLARNFCQYIIQQTEEKQKRSAGLLQRKDCFHPLGWIIPPEF
uniref:C-type lectin domain family 1 member B n=1 Tax=Cavia porcellus TaxID=10141 RepID=A0A286XJB5_CAVPO